MTPEQEQWAFAAGLLEKHGGEIGPYIMRRIARLKDANNEIGVRFWITIADKIVQLAGPDEDDQIH
jgi:hypothetical protein